MATIISSNDFFDELKKLIPNLPDNVISLDLHLDIHSAVTATIEMYAEHRSLDKVTKTYQLLEDETVLDNNPVLKRNEWIVNTGEYALRPWFKSAYIKSIAAHNEIDQMYYKALEKLNIGHRYH